MSAAVTQTKEYVGVFKEFLLALQRKALVATKGLVEKFFAIVINEEVIHHFHDILTPIPRNTGNTILRQRLVIWDVPEWEYLPH